MTITAALRDKFARSFLLYRDLAATLSADVLGSKLGDLPSNSVGSQLWCVVGARESYGHAIEAGSWSGFDCSLTDAGDPEAVTDALRRSQEVVTKALEGLDGFSDAQNHLVLDLLEHEAAHQGQLIRYLYGLSLSIPESWKSRYALD